ncbi:MAG: hypothetical protein F6K36_25690 [Symploca sp. SIO3C6]|uniref:Uncharacterized protein n=1 Tax=Symploca sp. SIO1C4 TaxID=2607765 RepID=A0A6B3NRT2_9CYAN|nr:hypothetical protein [Symploca sp. SIO3C6]NER31898.1 hypothetical protein [Symploca sp. SIO1C4]NET08145.1 hypothetical protein [Symploca sp. SIO2B6]
MVRAVEQIEQDLAKLEVVIAQVKTELSSAYSQYLTLLGQAVRQQLIMASYRVCTQGYPETFMGLSFNQRQQLQSSMRQLGKQVQEKLLSPLESGQNTNSTASDNQLETDGDESTEAKQQLLSTIQEYSPELIKLSEVSKALENSEDDNTPQHQREQPKSWQEQLEVGIKEILQTTSVETNNLLQKTGIIPNKLPSAVLEAAAKADTSGEPSNGSPNLLNLLVEVEGDTEKTEQEDSSITRIVAVNLRLPEIEFADHSLTASRNQIRQILAKLKTLERKNRKIQRERIVAKAEAAWRASWFED